MQLAIANVFAFGLIVILMTDNPVSEIIKALIAA